MGRKKIGKFWGTKILLPMWSKTSAMRRAATKQFDLRRPRTFSVMGSRNGRNGEIRTLDPLLPKQVRYQAALHSDVGFRCVGLGGRTDPSKAGAYPVAQAKVCSTAGLHHGWLKLIRVPDQGLAARERG